MTSELSDPERARYARQIAELGEDAQRRLKDSRVIVIGAGAAGSTAAALLVSRGVGYVGVVDGDTVLLGDLAAQTVYYTPDVGRGKADTLAGKLGLLNPEVQTEGYPVDLDAANAAAIVEGHALVLDCTHDPEVAGALARVHVAVIREDDPTALAAEAVRRLALPAAKAAT